MAEASLLPYVSTFASAVTAFSIGPEVRLTVRVFTASGVEVARRARVGCEQASHSSMARRPLLDVVVRRTRSIASVASST